MTSFLTDSWENIEKFFTGHNVNTTGMNPQQAKVATTASAVKNIGLFTAVMGGINGAIGSYYSAQAAQYQEKSQASSLQFQSDMAALNAHQAELSAQSIQEQGKTEVSQYTMRAGQERSAEVANTGARGVAIGEGSSRDVLASMDLVKDLDVLSINSNAARAAAAARTGATNYSNQSLIDRTSAGNLNRSAESISPGMAATSSLLTSATGVANQWDWRRKLRLQLAGGMN